MHRLENLSENTANFLLFMFVTFGFWLTGVVLNEAVHFISGTDMAVALMQYTSNPELFCNVNTFPNNSRNATLWGFGGVFYVLLLILWILDREVGRSVISNNQNKH